MESHDVASIIWQVLHIVDPRSKSCMESQGVASNICQALPEDGGQSGEVGRPLAQMQQRYR
jgi:hypothetical protein